MQYSDKLLSAIRDQDVIAARAIILSCLDSDKKRSTPQAVNMAKEISGKYTDPNDPLFQAENSTYLGEIPLKTLWNVQFFDRIKAAMYANFSLEKLELAEKAIQVLREKGLPDFQIEAPPKQSAPQHATQNQKKSQNQNKTGEDGKEPSPKPRLQSDSHAQEDFLKGMLVGGVALGGAGLLIGLATGCAVKAAITGMIVGGVAGGVLNHKMKHK